MNTALESKLETPDESKNQVEELKGSKPTSAVTNVSHVTEIKDEEEPDELEYLSRYFSNPSFSGDGKALAYMKFRRNVSFWTLMTVV